MNQGKGKVGAILLRPLKENSNKEKKDDEI